MVERYKKKHFKGIKRLLREGWEFKKEYEIYDYEYVDPFLYERKYLKDPYKCWVYTDKEVEGFIIGFKSHPLIFEIFNHYVGRGHRRKGIAKKLKKCLTEYAKQNGYVMTASLVWSGNKESIKLNKSMNWSKKYPQKDQLYFYKIL